MATATKDPPAEPQSTDDAELAAATAAAITNLLPRPHCTLSDLADELGLSSLDRQAINNSRNVPRMVGRDEGYRTKAVAREIVALALEWQRTKLSYDRERYTLDELINPTTIYPAHQIEEMTGVSYANLCNTLGRTSLSSTVAGNDLISALADCRAQGVRVFFSGAFIRRAVKENESELVSPPITPSNPVDAAILSRRSRAIQDRATDHAEMLREWGRLVRLCGDLNDTDTECVGEIATELGFDGNKYHRDVEILNEVDSLEKIDSKAERTKAKKALDNAIAERKDLELQLRKLPDKIRAAGKTTQQARLYNAKCSGAANRIAEFREQHTHLFTDDTDDVQ